MTLLDKKSLVCGSTQGIGLATAQALANAGSSVTLVARNEKKLQEALATLSNTAGQTHSYFVADFSNQAAVEQMLTTIQKSGDVYHILVNNTGGPAGGPLLDASVEQLSDALSMHLLNNQRLVQTLVTGMKTVQYGRIINIISTSVKQPIPGLGVSNTTRWAVASWAKTLANELAPWGITVNNVLPGLTETTRLDAVVTMRAKEFGKSEEETRQILRNGIPTRRFVQANEIGAAIAFLASPIAGSINGINLPVDGGATLSL